MATLSATIAATLTKSLLHSLPSKVAEEFEDVDEDEFKEFLEKFLAEELKGAGKVGKNGKERKPQPKGKNGKGRVSGFLVFSNATRDSVKEDNPDLKGAEVTKELGRMWREEMGDEEKQEWNDKAKKMNRENGLEAPEPKQAAKGGAASAKKVASKRVKIVEEYESEDDESE